PPAAAAARPAAPSQSAPSAVPSPSSAAAAPPPAPPRAPEPPAPVDPPRPKVAHLKAGDPIVIRTTRAFSSNSAKTGDAFSAILEQPIESDGWVVAGAGARIDGRIVESDKGGRIKG